MVLTYYMVINVKEYSFPSFVYTSNIGNVGTSPLL